MHPTAGLEVPPDTLRVDVTDRGATDGRATEDEATDPVVRRPDG